MKPNSDSLPVKTVDLFAGCGGMSLGFGNAGFEMVAGYDSWDLAVEAHQLNSSHPAHLLDLDDVDQACDHISRYMPDVIIGGPPCQDFSIAGKRVEAGRANLTVAFASIVASLQPSLFVMENVYSIQGSQALAEAERVFRAAGFSLTSRVIDASRVGVPQMRRRFFLVGAKGLPDEFFGGFLDRGLSTTRMTVADYFGDSLRVEHYYAHPRSYKRRAIFSIHEPSATVRRVNRPVPVSYQKHPADKAPPTEDLRPLTFEERSQIQTFPPGFRFLGARSKREHLMANAVPVKLAEYVGQQILAGLEAYKDGIPSPSPRNGD
jgi:DNA (cytosine-5)-methyltransferase 1